jgi:hypothetical protein
MSDPGTENFGIVNAHTTVRQWLDPSLQGTLQHQWMFKKKNIKPEISWSVIRSAFSPGFEEILQGGVNDGYIDFQNATPIEM